ncbi:hypothetical protein L211DRAFT_840385 [Terfezia boudieri ATCC MYA-4762]|uniref:Uncharacterized protein n=1 Tax=Terfezia boudieri ATCC MYA-4762 TaxID=1051890 RepID=A0A3N4LK33_9PEZI|nr:hypothetical protein L211DRAFT_840385 [Terfezia boudieri ATCC MYA-4762]
MDRRPAAGAAAVAVAEALAKNIEWDPPMEEWIARRLVDKWEAWEKGPKIDLCRVWVKELKLKE